MVLLIKSTINFTSRSSLRLLVPQINIRLTYVATCPKRRFMEYKSLTINSVSSVELSMGDRLWSESPPPSKCIINFFLQNMFPPCHISVHQPEPEKHCDILLPGNFLVQLIIHHNFQRTGISLQLYLQIDKSAISLCPSSYSPSLSFFIFRTLLLAEFRVWNKDFFMENVTEQSMETSCTKPLMIIIDTLDL